MKGLDKQVLGARFIVEGVKLLQDVDDAQANELGQRLVGYLCELRTREAMLETAGEDNPELRALIPGFAEPLPDGMELVSDAVGRAERDA